MRKRRSGIPAGCGELSSRSLPPPTSPASCVAKDKAPISMWAPLKDPISSRQTLPSSRPLFVGGGGCSLGLESGPDRSDPGRA